MTKISIFLYIILHRSILTKAYQDLDEFATIGLQGIYGENKTIINIDYKHEYVIRYDDSSSKYPYVIYAWTHQQIEGHPVFVVVRQQNQVTSWELPMTIENKKKVVKFPSTSRTLCHNNMDVIAQLPRNITFNAGSAYSFHKELSVSLSTSSRSPIAVTLRVDEENNFYVTDYEDYTVTVSPTEPRFFYYKFLPEDHENFTNTVILEVFSEDNTCLIVSVQNASCPVYDLDETMTFNGKYQTINYKGGIIVKV